jgi:flagellar transcriptional activator FlhD
MELDPHIAKTQEVNLSYLMLAQAIVRDDKAQALYRLGVEEPVAELLGQLSPQQLVRMASRNLMLCTLRFDDELIWGLLASDHQAHEGPEPNAAGLHASVLMAGRPAVGSG